ncbi:hypothetical protein D6W19_003111 [Escherichia coli]|nr:hypothetical protein [Escherichia coli]
MTETFKRLTQAQKNKLRHKAIEALHDENYGEDGDGFHEYATAQAVISLVDENAALKAEVCKLKSAGNKLDVTPAQLESIKRMTDVMASMIGCRDDESSNAWGHYVQLIDSMLSENGHKRYFKGED